MNVSVILEVALGWMQSEDATKSFFSGRRKCVKDELDQDEQQDYEEGQKHDEDQE